MGPTSTVRNRCKANGDFADFEGNLPDGFRWNNFRGCAPARVPFRTSCVIHKKRLACDGRRSGHGGGSRVWHWRSGSVCPEGVCKRNATALDGISLSLFFNPFIYLCVSIYTRVFIVSVSAPSVQTNNRYCANRDGRREGLFTFRTQPSGPARKQSGTGRHCRRPGATQNHRNNPQNATNIRSKPRFATLRRRYDRRFTMKDHSATGNAVLKTNRKRFNVPRWKKKYIIYTLLVNWLCPFFRGTPSCREVRRIEMYSGSRGYPRFTFRSLVRSIFQMSNIDCSESRPAVLRPENRKKRNPKSNKRWSPWPKSDDSLWSRRRSFKKSEIHAPETRRRSISPWTLYTLIIIVRSHVFAREHNYYCFFATDFNSLSLTLKNKLKGFDFLLYFRDNILFDE